MRSQNITYFLRIPRTLLKILPRIDFKKEANLKEKNSLLSEKPLSCKQWILTGKSSPYGKEAKYFVR